MQLEDLSIVLALLFFGVAGAIPGIAPNQANEMTGAAASTLQTVAGIGSQVVVNGLILLLLLRHQRVFAPRRAALRWSLLLSAWALASTFWSQDPLLTARRAVPFALAAAFGAFLAFRLPPRRLLILLQVAFALLACWSAVLALGFPSIGLDASTGHSGDWQGAFTQKNACGRAMVFALATIVSSERLSLGRALLFAVFTAELVFSGSRGAWVLGAVLVAGVIAFRASCRLDRRTRSALLAGSAVVVAFLLAFSLLNFASLAPLLGRDATLTGRTAIWHEVWLAILHHPVLGYGFSAFWRGAAGASWSVVVALRFVLFHAHNGFLEIWLELGVAGLLLFAFGFLRAAFLLWPEVRSGHFAAAAWPLSTLLLIALYDVDENTVLSFNGLFWVLYVSALTRIELLASNRKAVRQLLAQKGAVAPTPLPISNVQTLPLPSASRPPSAFIIARQAPANVEVCSPWL